MRTKVKIDESMTRRNLRKSILAYTAVFAWLLAVLTINANTVIVQDSFDYLDNPNDNNDNYENVAGTTPDTANLPSSNWVFRGPALLDTAQNHR